MQCECDGCWRCLYRATPDCRRDSVGENKHGVKLCTPCGYARPDQRGLSAHDKRRLAQAIAYAEQQAIAKTDEKFNRVSHNSELYS